MKIIAIALTLFSLSLTSIVDAQVYSKHRAIDGTADVEKAGGKITLTWTPAADAQSYTIYRRTFGVSPSWGTAIATLGANASSFEDAGVNVGVVYEYRIQKRTTSTYPSNGATIFGYSYISASIEKPAVHDRGVMWILVTKLISDSLPTEIEQLKSDLAGDGWDVYSEVVNSSASVADVRGLISNKRSSTHGIDAVYLLGNIPVPYSGMYCGNQYTYPPDGHGATDNNAHCGAWPADVYYSVYTGSWTDTDSISIAKRAENDNLIGDGKFDNNTIPGASELQIGRVDLSRLSTFPESEVALTKRYLQKAHDFKITQTVPVNKAVIENNFGGFEEGFSSGAIRDFTGHVGRDSVVHADIFTTINDETAGEDYLFAYGAGAGWYTSCAGVGNTADFLTKNPAMFNSLFGSFYGDFDIVNNFMRASLASQKNGLSCTWSGRPKWVAHSLAMGDNLGRIARLSQNNGRSSNGTEYESGFYQTSPHVALLGDPSLRTIMVSPSSGITLTSEAGDTKVKVEWTASTDAEVIGYNVYRSHRPYGGYELVTSTPESGTSFEHDEPYDGTNWYMVRAVKLTETASGTYFNQSIGDRAEINGMKGIIAKVENTIQSENFTVYPTLTSNDITLVKATATKQTAYIISSLGVVVKTITINAMESSLDVSELASGMYVIQMDGISQKFVKR